MSLAQAPNLRAHLQNLADMPPNGAAVTAYPTVSDLMLNWGATPNDVYELVARVRATCPRGYIIPFVCTETSNRLVMLKGNSIRFAIACGALILDLKYCRSRLRRIMRNLQNVAAGYPVNSAFRIDADQIAGQIDAATNGYGYISLAIHRLPILARRATVVERQYLHDLAVMATQ